LKPGPSRDEYRLAANSVAHCDCKRFHLIQALLANVAHQKMLFYGRNAFIW
jgi:hypothetical protein